MWPLESSDDDVDDDVDDRACNVSGHNFEQEHPASYYAHGVVGHIWSKSFRVDKSVLYKCTKCGTIDKKTETIGKIRVDTDTDELFVDQ